MIQQVAAFQVGQQVFPTIQEAQKEELRPLFRHDGDARPNSVEEVVSIIVEHAGEIVEILTGQPRTKKPRSDKGKKRTPKTAPNPAT
jgi:hypothetical protein